MRITKIADSSDANRMKIDRLDRDLSNFERDTKKDIKSVEKDIKEIKKDISAIKKTLKDLNIGKRLYYQERTVFTSLQRKMERLERVEKEWTRFKDTIEDKIKREITKKERASVSTK